MPLKPGSSRATISSNISEMEANGHKYSQAVAASLRSAYGPRRDDGGTVTGALLGATDGRADAVHTSVPDGSHIIPSDVVSALGEGNSVAGASKLSKMFPNSGGKGSGGGMKAVKPVPINKAPGAPAPMRLPRMAQPMHQGSPHILKGHTAMPRMPHMPGMPKGLRSGGKTTKHVKVRLSDGEFAIHPADVETVAGQGDRERGHRALDAWILMVRHHDIERRKRLPGPVQS